jgi:hypothetical protein
MAPDSRAVAIPLEKGIAELTLDRGEWKHAACEAAGRNLTRDEWALYLHGSPRSTCRQWPAPS